MRVSFVTALAMLAMTPHAVPVVAEDGTFTACLMKNGRLNRGALGVEPKRSCRSYEPEIHLQMGQVRRFNFELDGAPGGLPVPEDIDFTKVIVETDEFLIFAQCGGPELGGKVPGLMRVVRDATLISLEIRSSDRELSGQSIVLEEDTNVDILVQSFGPPFAETWVEGDLMPYENRPYIASLRIFVGPGLEKDCAYSGEVRVIELPQLE